MLGKAPYKYCFLIGQTLVMSSLYETHIGDVITLCFLVLKCLHQFSCSSYQKQGSPSTINKYSWCWEVPRSKYCFLIRTYEYTMKHKVMTSMMSSLYASGPEVFTPIFLQFLPKTRLAKYHQWSLNACDASKNVTISIRRSVKLPMADADCNDLP